MKTIPALPVQPASGDDVAAERRAPAAWRHRGVGTLLLLASAGVLVLAAMLDPNPRGMGTHQQLGLPPCGFLTATGFPCATCGMTTSFALAADGRILAAFIAQPAGAVLALLTAAAAIVGAHALLFATPLLGLWQALWRKWTLLPMIALFLGAWLYKILMVSFS